MDVRERAEACRKLIAEIRRIEEDNPELRKLEFGPETTLTTWPNGMPRGTNNPIMALLQRMDINEAIDKIETYYRELEKIA